MNTNNKSSQQQEALYQQQAQIINYLQSLISQLPDEPAKGSLLDRMQETGDFKTPIYFQLRACAECVVENLSFLSSLSESERKNGSTFSPWSIAPIARTALLSACRLIYVFLPESFETQVANAQKVDAVNATNERRYAEASSQLKELKGLALPGAHDLEKITGSKVNDKELLDGAVALILQALDSQIPDHGAETGGLAEHVVYMWQVWSSFTHGQYWALEIPPMEDAFVFETMPRDWLTDFMNLVALSHLGIDAFCRSLVNGSR